MGVVNRLEELGYKRIWKYFDTIYLIKEEGENITIVTCSIKENRIKLNYTFNQSSLALAEIVSDYLDRKYSKSKPKSC